MRDKNFCGIRGTAKPFLFLFGTLLLILIASPACAQALSVTATADPVTGPAPLNVTFTSTVTGGTAPYTYLWDFGDTETDTAANPSHMYDIAGNYTVRLTVTDSTATAVTITVATIRVYLEVVVDLCPQGDCGHQCGPPPLNVCFNASADGGVAPYAYTWNFGDGAPAYNIHEACPCHGYEACGLYTATLTVTDAVGNSGTGSIPIYVFDYSVTPSADVVMGVSNLRVNFDSLVTFCGPSFPLGCPNYSWDFGDGTTTGDECGGKSPQHIYSSAGTFTVTVTVTIDCGTDTFEKTGTIDITVVPDPTVVITSPTDYGEWVGPTATIQSMVYTKSTVTRVDYFIDGSYVGSSSVAPYNVTLDLCGANGIYQITAIAYTTSGTSSTSDAVNVVVNNPTLDGTNFVLKNPYRVKFYGTGFKMGAKLYINGYQAPITKVLNSSTIIAKGGRALKNLMPEGVPVLITVENLDGGCTNTVTFQR